MVRFSKIGAGRLRRSARDRTGGTQRARVARPALALTALATVLAFGLPAAAACVSDEDADVRVGVRDAPPFVAPDPIRGRSGLAFDLWSSIERELQEKGVIGRTVLVECPLGAQLEALGEGTLDLVISPLTITAERLERFDFTHQYLSSGLTVAQRSGGAIDFGHAGAILRDTLARDGVPRAILLFLLGNLLLAALIARELRRSEAFAHIAAEPLPLRLCRYGLESVVRTAGLKGLDDSARSTLARILDVFVAVVGTLLSATVVGLLTTALFASMSSSRAVTVGDLPDHRVATLADSTAEAFFEEAVRATSDGPGPVEPCAPALAPDSPAGCLTASSWREAVELLAEGEVDLVLGDWAQLAAISRLPDFVDRIGVQSEAFRLEPYGWGVSRGRPELRAAIDRALLARLRSTEWRHLVQDYLGSGSISPE